METVGKPYITNHEPKGQIGRPGDAALDHAFVIDARIDNLCGVGKRVQGLRD